MHFRIRESTILGVLWRTPPLPSARRKASSDPQVPWQPFLKPRMGSVHHVSQTSKSNLELTAHLDRVISLRKGCHGCQKQQFSSRRFVWRLFSQGQKWSSRWGTAMEKHSGRTVMHIGYRLSSPNMLQTHLMRVWKIQHQFQMEKNFQWTSYGLLKQFHSSSSEVRTVGKWSDNCRFNDGTIKQSLHYCFQENIKRNNKLIARPTNSHYILLWNSKLIASCNCTTCEITEQCPS